MNRLPTNMKVVSTNTGETRDIKYRGKTVKTGIYKFPDTKGIFLESKDVKGDSVIDRRYHGGIDKACYLYSFDVYSYWKNLYPDLDWEYGMFGENLTIDGLDERNLHIGNIYEVGDATVEISQPRQPCFKLGIRMSSQTIIKKFINTTYSGTYVRVLKDGLVKPADTLKLIKNCPENPTIADAYYALYQHDASTELIKSLLACKPLAESCKIDLQKKLK